MIDHVTEALYAGAGILWKARRALTFGYLISAGIQVLVTRERVARTLGERGAREAALAGFFGFVSSSCSFAALAASRTVLAKGGARVGVMVFLGADLVAATVIYILAKYYGWRYALRMSALLYMSMVEAGVTVHCVFALAGILPTARPALQEMVASRRIRS